MIYVLADRNGQTVSNTYSGMTEQAITDCLTAIGCTNIRFVTPDEWTAVAYQGSI